MLTFDARLTLRLTTNGGLSMNWIDDEAERHKAIQDAAPAKL